MKKCKGKFFTWKTLINKGHILWLWVDTIYGVTNSHSFGVYTECKLPKPRKFCKITVACIITVLTCTTKFNSSTHEKTTRFAQGFDSRIIIRKCYYSKREFYTVDCESNSGEGYY